MANVKHDKQGVRTAAEVERKYDLTRSYDELREILSEGKSASTRAQAAAERVSKEVDNLNDELNHSELLNRLTDSTGIIASTDGTVQIDTVNNKVIINTLISEEKGKFELSAEGLVGFVWDAENETFVSALTIEPDGKIGGKTVSWKDNGDGTYTLIGS